VYDTQPDLKIVVDQLINGFFSNQDSNEFKDIYDNLMHNDQYFVLKDFEAYRQAHERANTLYKNKTAWLKASIINIARSGYFSSDRTINQYAKEIWGIQSLTH
jgi:starch phosphorylase